MTKQEVIEKAYLDVGIPFNKNSENGWNRIKAGQYSSKYEKLDLLKTSSEFYSIRPKSLKGIETNNGWIKIESEDDLPKESGEYFTIYENDKDCFVNSFYDNRWEFSLYKITHYQPITEPKPPIF